MLGIRLKADRPHHAFHTAAATRSTGQLPALLPVLADRKACRSRFRCVVTWIMPVLLVATALIPGSVHGNESGGVAWHRSLEQATAAAAGQNRQVLVLFTAAWSPASTQLKKHVLNDPDAVSLLNACFETVLIDVDDDPETTNSLGMRHVPGGCILAADGSVVSRFECPSSTGLFIATVARQLQQVPPGDLESAQPAVVAGTVTVVAEQPELANDFSTAGSLLADAAATGPITESGAVGQIAAKVRGLSHFANTELPAPQQLADDAPFTSNAISPSATVAAVPPAAMTADLPRIPATDLVEKPPVASIGQPAAVPTAVTETAIQQDVKADSKTSPEPSPYQPGIAAVASQLSPRSVPMNDTRAMVSEPSRAPWDAEPEQSPEVAPQLTTANPWRSETPATATLAAATPAVTGGLIEPEGRTSQVPARPTSPWLQPAPQPTAQDTGGTFPTATPSAAAAAATAPSEQLAAAPSQPATATQSTPPAGAPQRDDEAAKPNAKSPNPFLAAVTNPFGWFKQEQPAKPEQATTQQPEQSQQIATARYAQKPVPSSDAAQPTPMPLGLEGFCPVTLVESGNWAEGQAGWGARHRGRTYLFRGLEEQQAFLADPDRYAPALSGDDPVAAFDSGTALPGERRYGVTYQQRIYLFASPESRATFAANPQRYTSRVQLAEQPANVGEGGTILR
jgi:YHS domain-containing protein/thioredoxin-like negative regulator of GroEL